MKGYCGDLRSFCSFPQWSEQAQGEKRVWFSGFWNACRDWHMHDYYCVENRSHVNVAIALSYYTETPSAGRFARLRNGLDKNVLKTWLNQDAVQIFTVSMWIRWHLNEGKKKCLLPLMLHIYILHFHFSPFMLHLLSFAVTGALIVMDSPPSSTFKSVYGS